MEGSIRRIAGVAVFLVAAASFSGCGDDNGTGPIGTTLQEISVGLLHTCALGANGTAFCWGWNRDGQLGDGTRSDRTTPVAVRSGDITFTAVRGGGGHSCGIGTDQLVYCWGFNMNGQLGDGTMATRTSVAPVDGGMTFDEIALGASHSCGVTPGGDAFCWGWNANGQLGDGSQTERTTPVAVSGSLVFRTLSASSFHTCGVTTDGDGYCWGRNDLGQLGDGTTTESQAPVLVTGGHSFTTIAAGFVHTCGLRTDGDVLCWGSNEFGQLGQGNVTNSETPVVVTGGNEFAQLTSGAQYNCAVTTGGDGWCWGLNGVGQLGAPSDELCIDVGSGTQQQFACSPSANPISGGLSFAAISSGSQHTCGITTDQVAYCWGLGDRGQLGDGSSGSANLSVGPVRVAGQS